MHRRVLANHDCTGAKAQLVALLRAGAGPGLPIRAHSAYIFVMKERHYRHYGALMAVGSATLPHAPELRPRIIEIGFTQRIKRFDHCTAHSLLLLLFYDRN